MAVLRTLFAWRPQGRASTDPKGDYLATTAARREAWVAQLGPERRPSAGGLRFHNGPEAMC
ncbi:hypothetical protein A5787_00855 [Mycobacterium sp. 852002-50816_SCH5313054-b]|nr:hypothetical protein A5787_00855 [Mycobacterium sp. 852002-50816_SCH5313054-b]